MTAFNIVRFRVKPDQIEQFIEAHRKFEGPGKGFGGGWLVKTGDQSFCIIGQWKSFQDIVDARPAMIGFLDQMRDKLEDLGGGLGVTDPVSGEAVLQLGTSTAAKKRAAKKSKPKATKKGAAGTRKGKAVKKSTLAGRKTKPAKKTASASRKSAPKKRKG